MTETGSPDIMTVSGFSGSFAFGEGILFVVPNPTSAKQYLPFVNVSEIVYLTLF